LGSPLNNGIASARYARDVPRSASPTLGAPGGNAASHLAFGNAYRFTLAGSEAMSDEQFKAAGGNMSGIHVDFMVGSNKLDIDGLTRDGQAEPIMRQGEWAFNL
jgi:hypothetical protein